MRHLLADNYQTNYNMSLLGIVHDFFMMYPSNMLVDLYKSLYML